MPPRETAADPHLSALLVDPGPVPAVTRALSARGEGRGDLVVAVGHAVGDTPQSLAARLDAFGLEGVDLVATHEPGSAPGALTSVPLPPRRFIARRLAVLGFGDASPDAARAAGAALGRATRGLNHVVADLTHAVDDEALAAFVEGFMLGGWASPRWTAAGPVAGAEVPTQLRVITDRDPDVATDARVRALATVRARILGATPSNIKSPAWLAAQARALARRHGLDVTVRGARQLRAEGFGGLLAVGGGSATPPALVTLSWVPPAAGPRTRHVVLVGKGITFDTGGLDVKPAEGMLPMKTDMLGAGIVLAVMAACRDLGVGVRVTGLLPLAENAVSGAAYRPGDVITQYGGSTVEIGNTDAEGRIVLADALAHADRDLEPDLIVDVATLTGAARLALARVMAPVFGSDQGLVADLVAAGEVTGEQLWPMPMPDAYRPGLRSDVADLRQVVPGGAGSIMAAMFLAHFAGQRAWAHLDIAGTGRSEVDSGILGKGPTAFGTRLLLRWLQTLA